MEKFGDIEFMNGKYRAEGYHLDFLLPRRIASRLVERRDRMWIAKKYIQLERMLGGKLDYIGNNPKKNADIILKNKKDDTIGYIYSILERHQRIVIDGNGDMVFKKNPKRNLYFTLTLIELAERLGKDVFYVNAMFSDFTLTERNDKIYNQCIQALRKCKGIAFRDRKSLDYLLTTETDLNAHYIPDSLFYWGEYLNGASDTLPPNAGFIMPYSREDTRLITDVNFHIPYICVTGGAAAAFNRYKSIKPYIRLVESLKELNLPILLIPTCEGDSFLHEVADETETCILPAEMPVLMGGAILSNARLFITGRYHPSILASLGGTPCVFLGTDSHKLAGLQDTLDYKDSMVYSARPTKNECMEIIDQCDEFLTQGDRLRNQIQSNAAISAEKAKQVSSLVMQN